MAWTIAGGGADDACVAFGGCVCVLGGRAADRFGQRRMIVAALLLFGIVILYFIVFRRFLGGTVFQRLLGAR